MISRPLTNRPSLNRSIICRASQVVLRSLLPLAPARFRDWGTAMFAELEFIDNPLESVRWSLGCLTTVLLEIAVNGCLGICRGAGFWIMAKGEGSYMRKMRIVAVLGVLAVLSFFIAPSFRQAMSVAADTLNGAPWARRGDRVEEQERNRLRTIAEQDRDAEMLAYVAIHDDDLKIAGQDADKAVAIDPRWTWVYYVLASRNMAAGPRSSSPQAAWIAKLQQWDPQNATPHLLNAQQFFYSARSGRAVAQQTADDKLWNQKMAEAFDSPRYDIYFQQRFDLEKDIARRRGIGDPLRLTVSVISHPLPNLTGVRQYEKLILSGAQGPFDLHRQAARVASFGERMMAGNTEIEEIIGWQFALDGYQKLQNLVAPADQALITARITQLEAMKSQRTRTFYRASAGVTRALAMNAAIVETCFAFMLAASLALAISAAVFVFRRSKWSRTIGTASYVAVGVMLIACVVAFVAYLPYAQLVAQAMAPQVSVKTNLPLLLTFLSFATPPTQFLYGPQARVYGWAILVALLSLAGLWLVVRQFRKSPPRPEVVSAG